MFGSIGTFNAAGSQFNNTTGNVINTDVGCTLSAVDLMNLRSRAATAVPMFGDVERLNADHSVFNNTVGDQYNTNYRSSRHKPIARTPSLDRSMPLPHMALVPAEGRMFGGVEHPQSEDRIFDNRMGHQINIQNVPDQAAFPTDLPGPPSQGRAIPARSRGPFLSKHDIASHHDKPGPAPKTSSFVDATIGVSDLVLTTLQGSAQFSPVPFLSQAAGIALTILQGVQGSRDNMEGLARLASHACNLISSVILVQQEREREGRELAPELVANLEDLVEKLRPIRDFVLRQSNRNGFKRFITHKLDATKIGENRAKLAEALAEFGLRSNINVQDGVAQIGKRLEDLVEAVRQIGTQRAHADAMPPSGSI